MKSMNFSVNWPQLGQKLIDLTSKAVQFDLKCDHFRVKWVQYGRTLIDPQPEAVQSALKSTHVDQTRLQAAPTLIDVVAKGVQVSTERKASRQKETASSQKAIKVTAKADRSSQGLTAFRAGWTHAGYAFTASLLGGTQLRPGSITMPSTWVTSSRALTDLWLKPTHAGLEWLTLRQKQFQVDRIQTAAAAEVANAVRIAIQSPMPRILR